MAAGGVIAELRFVHFQGSPAYQLQEKSTYDTCYFTRWLPKEKNKRLGDLYLESRCQYKGSLKFMAIAEGIP
ncbi:MAG: hypothetical protein EBU46_13425 [Nitrosomonadaceae bacterium]|nr:hypothetical protein [Nitrosomonadaceae bacterium]